MKYFQINILERKKKTYIFFYKGGKIDHFFLF